MYEHKTENDFRSPLEKGLAAFDGKWKTRIICCLSNNGSLRYTALKKELDGITDAVLALTLKELTDYSIISRTQFNEIPVRVEYDLTKKGIEALPILKDICQWTQKYNPKSEQVRCGCGRPDCKFDLKTN